MKRLVISATILTVATFQIACHSGASVQKTFNIAEAQMDDRPDSALLLLRHVDPGTLTIRSLRARHALLLSQALDKNYIDLKSDSVIAPAVEYYARHGNRKDKAYTNYYLGCIRYNAGQIDKAVGAMVAAETHAEAIEDSYLLARIFSCLGCMYLDQHSFRDADSMYMRAEAYYRIEADTVNVGYVLMNRAKVYSLMNRPIDAASEYEKARAVFASTGDRANASEMTRNIVNEMQDDLSVTTDSLKWLLCRAYATAGFESVPSTDYSMWAAIYLRENKLDSARYFGLRALAEGPKIPNIRSGVILRMSMIEEQSGNYQQAIGYLHEYHKLYSFINKSAREQLVQEAEKHYHNRELAYNNELLRLHTKYINIGWIVLLIACLSGLGLFFVRKIRRYRQYIMVLNDNYDTFKARYIQLSEEMDGCSAEEDRLLNALESRMTGLQKLLDKAYTASKPHLFVEEFKKFATSLGGKDSDFVDLQFVVNKRYYGLVDYLRKTYPQLTDYDLDMLCMLKLGFSFNCLRLLHQHENVKSIYSRRTKIRRKMGLEPRHKLEDYLSEVVGQLKPKDSE